MTGCKKRASFCIIPLLYTLKYNIPELFYAPSNNTYTFVHNNPLRYYDPDGQWAIAIPLFVWGVEAICVTTINTVCTVVGSALIYWSGGKLADWYDQNYNRTETDENDDDDEQTNVFPENPDHLLPELERDRRGHIRPADNIRIRPEKHDMDEGETYNPRHHGQHYHVETRRDPSGNWRVPNRETLKPPGYELGEGSGFIPGETFPGA